MKLHADGRLRILEAATATAGTIGLSELTIADVAKVAGVSSALVHYHFDTKQALIVAAAERVAGEDAGAVASALAGEPGLGTLDRLWEALHRRAASGRAAFAAEVRLRGSRAPELAAALSTGAGATVEAIAKRLPGLLQELGSRLDEPREEVAGAVAVFLDGVTLALAGGRPADEVRVAYDAFWLMLIAAGQSGRRR